MKCGAALTFAALVTASSLAVGPSIAAPGVAGDPSLTVMVANFGKCVVNKHHAAARAYLLSPSGSESVQGDGRLFDRGCWSVSFVGNVGVSFTTGMYRDGLA